MKFHQTQEIKKILATAKKSEKENLAFAKRLTKKKPKGLDTAMHAANKEVFAKTDCLDCGNCCIIAQPIFFPKDITRLANHFNITRDELKEKYLVFNKKDDYWETKGTPCVFLLKDKKCSVYESRPDGCREYPHMYKPKTTTHLPLIQQHVAICPAVYKVVEKLKEQFPEV